MIDIQPKDPVLYGMGVNSFEYDPEEQMVHVSMKRVIRPGASHAAYVHDETIELDLSIEVVDALLDPKRRNLLIQLARDVKRSTEVGY